MHDACARQFSNHKFEFCNVVTVQPVLLIHSLIFRVLQCNCNRLSFQFLTSFSLNLLPTTYDQQLYTCALMQTLYVVWLSGLYYIMQQNPSTVSSKIETDTSPFMCMHRTHFAGTVSKLVHTRTLVVYFFVLVETVQEQRALLPLRQL